MFFLRARYQSDGGSVNRGLPATDCRLQSAPACLIDLYRSMSHSSSSFLEKRIPRSVM